jgi:hypothetical protein
MVKVYLKLVVKIRKSNYVDHLCIFCRNGRGGAQQAFHAQ